MHPCIHIFAPSLGQTCKRFESCFCVLVHLRDVFVCVCVCMDVHSHTETQTHERACMHACKHPHTHIQHIHTEHTGKRLVVAWPPHHIGVVRLRHGQGLQHRASRGWASIWVLLFLNTTLPSRSSRRIHDNNIES